MKRHSKLGKIALNNALGGCDLVSHPSFYYSSFFKVMTVISSIFGMNVSINYSQTKVKRISGGLYVQIKKTRRKFKY